MHRCPKWSMLHIVRLIHVFAIAVGWIDQFLCQPDVIIFCQEIRHLLSSWKGFQSGTSITEKRERGKRESECIITCMHILMKDCWGVRVGTIWGWMGYLIATKKKGNGATAKRENVALESSIFVRATERKNIPSAKQSFWVEGTFMNPYQTKGPGRGSCSRKACWISTEQWETCGDFLHEQR